MGGIYGSKKVTCTLFRILAVTSVCSSVINVVLLSICLSTGRWVFGDLFCQIFAFISHGMVAGSVWLVALATIERYYKLMLPEDHRSVFSEINTKLLVMGLYILVAFILFNPIYGWGEYSEYKGFFQLNVHVTRMMSNNSTEEAACVNSNSTQYKYPGDLNSTKDLPNIITSNLQTSYHFFTRMVLSSPELFVIALRTSEKETLDSLLRSNTDGALGTSLLPELSNCDMDSYLCLSFVINETVIEGYKNIFVPFQVTNMCTVDFTTINKGAWGWILLYILSTGIAPYLIIYACTFAIIKNWKIITWDNNSRDLIQSRRFLGGCVFSSFLYSPYFVINLSNYFGHYVSPPVTIIVMYLYYCSNLIPCVFINPKYMCKTKIRSPTTGSIHETDSDEQEDIEMEIIPDQSPIIA